MIRYAWLLTSLAVLGLAAVAIPWANERAERFRGEPILRDYGSGMLAVAAAVVIFLELFAESFRLRLVLIAVCAAPLGFFLGAAQFE